MKRMLWAVVGVGLAWAAVAGAAETVSVLPLGDSITAGSDGGYRKAMTARLTDVYQRDVVTLGTQTDAALPPGKQAHEGHGGWRIYQLADNLVGFEKVDDSTHGGYWLTGGHGTGRGPIKPAFVTLMAGINDLNGMMLSQGNSPLSERSDDVLKTLQERMTRLVGTLTETLPDATILVSSCTPYCNGLLDEKWTGATPANRAAWAKTDGVSAAQELGVNHWVLMFNRWLRDTYVPQMKAAGKKVVFVDQYANFILPDGSVRSWSDKEPEATHGPAGYRDYGLHPNQFGYDLMGVTWADAINAQLAGKP